jgi:hypothetical protein
MTILGQGGEEWRNFEVGAGYDPACWDAPLATARARIARLRMRPARLRILDRHGRPLAHQALEVEQVESAFTWGFCGWGWMAQMQAGTFDTLINRHAREAYEGLGNAINLMHYWAEKNCLDAPISEERPGEVSYDLLDRAINIARGQGLRCKGHPLFWGVPKAIPDWVLRHDPETRRRFLEVRIRQITARFKGRLQWYDAVNEAIWEPTLDHTEQRHWPHLEPIDEIAAECARVLGWARAEDPDACYLVNDYGLCRGDHNDISVPTNLGTRITADQQVDRFIAIAQAMGDAGASPDALGVQTAPGPWDHLPRFADTLDAIGDATGLPVHVTEFRASLQFLTKANLPDDEIDGRLGDYLEAVLTIAFGNPHCGAFWFWDEPRLLRGRRRTSVRARLQELLTKRWRTREYLRTDADGCLQFSGFAGDYRLRLTRDSGQRSGHSFTLDPASSGLDTTLRTAW